MSDEKMEKLIREQEALGRVVLLTIEGVQSMDLAKLVSQPTEGLLYDLNRGKVTCIVNIAPTENGRQWVNNYAAALVIEKLKNNNSALEATCEKLAEALREVPTHEVDRCKKCQAEKRRKLALSAYEKAKEGK